jgi:hypothetical protein
VTDRERVKVTIDSVEDQQIIGGVPDHRMVDRRHHQMA